MKPKSVIDLCLDKSKTIYSEEKRLYFPQTRTIRNYEDLQNFRRKVPLVLKPSVGDADRQTASLLRKKKELDYSLLDAEHLFGIYRQHISAMLTGVLRSASHSDMLGKLIKSIAVKRKYFIR
jgi:hypothetical protein